MSVPTVILSITVCIAKPWPSLLDMRSLHMSVPTVILSIAVCIAKPWPSLLDYLVN